MHCLPAIGEGEAAACSDKPNRPCQASFSVHFHAVTLAEPDSLSPYLSLPVSAKFSACTILRAT